MNTVSNAEAESFANALVGPPLDNHVSRAYLVDHERLVSHRHPHEVPPGRYTASPRTIVVMGRGFGR